MLSVRGVAKACSRSQPVLATQPQLQVPRPCRHIRTMHTMLLARHLRQAFPWSAARATALGLTQAAAHHRQWTCSRQVCHMVGHGSHIACVITCHPMTTLCQPTSKPAMGHPAPCSLGSVRLTCMQGVGNGPFSRYDSHLADLSLADRTCSTHTRLPTATQCRSPYTCCCCSYHKHQSAMWWTGCTTVSTGGHCCIATPGTSSHALRLHSNLQHEMPVHASMYCILTWSVYMTHEQSITTTLTTPLPPDPCKNTHSRTQTKYSCPQCPDLQQAAAARHALIAHEATAAVVTATPPAPATVANPRAIVPARPALTAAPPAAASAAASAPVAAGGAGQPSSPPAPPAAHHWWGAAPPAASSAA